MIYAIRGFIGLKGIEGLSEPLISNHLKLYEGYVNNTNTLMDKRAAMRSEHKTATPEFAELSRRLGWELNGMRLHELYFENLAVSGDAPIPSALAEPIAAEFGSTEAWMEEFKGIGKMRGIGWTILYYEPVGQRLINTWINEHDVGHPAGCRPLLVMDVFEHAYMLDYGINRADYIETFFHHIDWNVVVKRLQ